MSATYSPLRRKPEAVLVGFASWLIQAWSDRSRAMIERLMVLESRIIKRDDDAIAVLLDSSVAIAQLADPSSHKQICHFISAQAARIWLLAYDHLSPGTNGLVALPDNDRDRGIGTF